MRKIMIINNTKTQDSRAISEITGLRCLPKYAL